MIFFNFLKLQKQVATKFANMSSLVIILHLLCKYS